MNQETKKAIDKFVSKEPPQFQPNMEARHRKVKENYLCDMCGENMAEIVIMNPNSFPDNDWDETADYWDVCEGCNEFVSWGMGKSIDMAFDKCLRDLKTKKKMVYRRETTNLFFTCWMLLNVFNFFLLFHFQHGMFVIISLFWQCVLFVMVAHINSTNRNTRKTTEGFHGME